MLQLNGHKPACPHLLANLRGIGEAMRIHTEVKDNACGDAEVPMFQGPLMQPPSAQVQVVALECLPRIPAHKLSAALACKDLGKRILLCLGNSSKEVFPLPKFLLSLVSIWVLMVMRCSSLVALQAPKIHPALHGEPASTLETN